MAAQLTYQSEWIKISMSHVVLEATLIWDESMHLVYFLIGGKDPWNHHILFRQVREVRALSALSVLNKEQKDSQAHSLILFEALRKDKLLQHLYEMDMDDH